MIPIPFLFSFKITALLKFLAYRMAWWTGTSYLWRKSNKTGLWVYKLLAVLVYAASWGLVFWGSSAFAHWAGRFFTRRPVSL